MGFFKRFRDAMNEEFVIGSRNVQRYEADPDSLEQILAEQRARGLGSARGLRQHARSQASGQRQGLLARLLGGSKRRKEGL